METSQAHGIGNRVHATRRSLSSENRRSSSDRSSLGSDTGSFIESINRQWYEARRQQHPIDTAAILQRTKRYGKVYRSSDVATLPDPHIAKRICSQDRSSYISSEFKWGSSTASSMVGSSDESSVDFGSECRSVQSGDFEDWLSKGYGKDRMSFSNFSDATDPRLSFASLGSFANDKNVLTGDMCFGDLDADAPESKNEQSSSDESESQEEPSKTRISAATLYEDAVSQVLENSRRRSMESTNSVPEETAMERVSDSSVSMRGVMLNMYAKDKLDGIVTNPKKDSSLGKLNEIKRSSGDIQDKLNETVGSSNNLGSTVASKIFKTSLAVNKLDSDVLSGIPLRMRLERHVSMDSSVSTISDADTVIFNPASDLSRNNSNVSTIQKSCLTREPKVMLRSVSAEGILQKNKDGDSITVAPRTIVYTSVPRQKSSLVSRTEGRNIPMEAPLSPKFFDNPSSDSMEEQELTMDLSDSQVSEKEETSAELSKPAPKNSLSKVTVDILPYEERKRSSIKESDRLDNKKSYNASTSKKPSIFSEDSGEEGDEQVSSSMEVLHSSCEILDEPVRRRERNGAKHQECWLADRNSYDPLKTLYPLTIKKDVVYRTSITSFDTIVSDSFLGFSETEDEIAHEETSDDDLTLEEEAIKLWVEVR